MESSEVRCTGARETPQRVCLTAGPEAFGTPSMLNRAPDRGPPASIACRRAAVPRLRCASGARLGPEPRERFAELDHRQRVAGAAGAPGREGALPLPGVGVLDLTSTRRQPPLGRRSSARDVAGGKARRASAPAPTLPVPRWSTPTRARRQDCNASPTPSSTHVPSTGARRHRHVELTDSDSALTFPIGQRRHHRAAQLNNLVGHAPHDRQDPIHSVTSGLAVDFVTH